MNAARCLWLWAVIAAVSQTVLVSTAEEPTHASLGKHFIVAPGEVKWTKPPAGITQGTPSVDAGGLLRFALVEGNPLKPGATFTIRLGCDDGYKAAPHWHPTAENIVVLKGAFLLGTGDTFDASAMQEIPTRGYGFMPRRMHHFGQCKGETDILVYGVGPFKINWIAGKTGK